MIRWSLLVGAEMRRAAKNNTIPTYVLTNLLHLSYQVSQHEQFSVEVKGIEVIQNGS